MTYSGGAATLLRYPPYSPHRMGPMTKRERFAAFVGYALVTYGPWRLTCDPKTRFGAWCSSNAGNWIYRNWPDCEWAQRGDAELTGNK
jgi:hypothetical protein